MSDKSAIALRYWLQGAAEAEAGRPGGRDWFLAMQAMEFAAQYHVGFRKDGVTPEFHHQIGIANYIRTLHHWLMHPVETICVAFLHDVPEDKGVSIEEIRRLFGDLVADAVWRMTKEFRGVRRDDVLLFQEMARCPIASVVKGADRINNLQSMVGVFSPAKQISYVGEARELFLPMLKTARTNFRRQNGAYENIKLVMQSQMALITAIHTSSPNQTPQSGADTPAPALLRA